MRLFFALQPDQQTVMRIAAWRERQFSLAARPVPLGNMHMTLAFIGELPAAALENLCNDVENWRDRKRPRGGRLVLDQTGYWHRPGIYWLGPSTWPPSLSTLADGLRSIAGRSGGKRERKRFQPHITLFRGCQEPPVAPAVIQRIDLKYAAFSLFESQRGKRGVNYTSLQSWELEPDN